MENKYLKTLTLYLLLLALFYACSTSDSTVVVVEESPATAEAQQPDSVDEQFSQLTIGLIDSVTNFDPLFAKNLSTQRTLSLIYDGLYSLDRNGRPVPSIAASVEISDDSLQYVFTLNENKYFHNSPVFNAGVGRRVLATDVKRAFERTASLAVPEKAAQLLMDVTGFENYFLEQRSIYDPGKRVLDEVGGIQVLNQRTVAIILDEKDPDFLKKLASPYLYIYPQESINNNSRPLSDNPVGTGSYYLNRVDAGGQIVLSRDDRTSSENETPKLINRIDIIFNADESQLFQQFASGQTDWIPEIGPGIADQVLDENGSLKTSYEGDYGSNFNIVENNASRIIALYLNERATVDQDWLTNRLAYLTSEDFETRGEVSLFVDDFEIVEGAQPNEQYYASYTEDVFTKDLLTALHNIIFVPDSRLVLFDIRVPTKQTSIYTENSSSLHDSLDPLDNRYWLRMDTQIIGLYKSHINGIEPTPVPWQLHIEEIAVQNSGPTLQ